MRRLASACEAIAGTTKKLQKDRHGRRLSEVAFAAGGWNFGGNVCQVGRFRFGRKQRCRSADRFCGGCWRSLAEKMTPR